MSTEIRIDTLSLAGLQVDPQRAERIRTETVTQLQQLIAAEGLPPGASLDRQLDRVSIPPHSLSPAAGDREIGRVIARAIYRALR